MPGKNCNCEVCTTRRELEAAQNGSSMFAAGPVNLKPEELQQLQQTARKQYFGNVLIMERDEKMTLYITPDKMIGVFQTYDWMCKNVVLVGKILDRIQLILNKAGIPLNG